MSSSPPPFSTSSPTPTQPLRSEGLRRSPNARAYLLRNAGQDILMTLEEARQWFQQGFTIRDPTSRQTVDVGAVPVPSYAQGQGAFVREDEDEKKVRKALAKEWAWTE
ncbi:hypothetical protein N0V90_002228 [Kalmusia sp. IMI 367209]|nr:hypothetical protein N0V90_002228 [Kalmusia sp. IMI 367209]